MQASLLSSYASLSLEARVEPNESLQILLVVKFIKKKKENKKKEEERQTRAVKSVRESGDQRFTDTLLSQGPLRYESTNDNAIREINGPTNN